MKNLLICTQKMDESDHLLGFFVNWLRALAPYFDTVTVLCLERGEVSNLPKNCSIYSLGKEHGARSSWVYSWRFWRILVMMRQTYNSVFVHMNTEYLLLAGLWWRLRGKRVALWRNHPAGSWLTDIAIYLAHVVFYTSEQSYTARFAKAVRMPVGIPLPDVRPTHDDAATFLFLGRISPIKRIDTIVEAFRRAALSNGALLRIIGDPVSLTANNDYAKYVQDCIDVARSEGRLVLRGAGVRPEDTPVLYAKHSFFVNATDPGSFDKTILEAAAQGCIPLVAQDLWKGTELFDLSHALVFPFQDIEQLALCMERLVAFTPIERRRIQDRLYEYIQKEQSLTRLIQRLVTYL